MVPGFSSKCQLVPQASSHLVVIWIGAAADIMVQWLFSGADDHRIVLHDVRAGSKTGSAGKGEGAVAIMQGHQSWVLKVAASPDGKLLGSG